jgi:thermitase
MHSRRWILALAAAAGLALVLPGSSGGPSPAPEMTYVPGQVLVKFKPTTSTWARGALLSLFKTKVLQCVAGPDLYLVQTPAQASVEDIAGAFGRSPDVLYAQPNHIYAAQVTPNDMYFGYQYALFNKGQEMSFIPGSPQGQPSADIKAPTAWEETTGDASVVIAIIDTGVDLVHPDLKNKVVGPGWDFVNNDASADDDHGHGTMVAGIAAAETDNFEGIAGVAWNAKVLPVKVLDASGFGTDVTVIQGIQYALDHGAKVLLISWGQSEPSPALEAMLKTAYESGASLIAAAGNGNTRVAYPAAYEKYVCAVAATDYNDQRCVFSNYGLEVDTAAPGLQIFTTFPVAMSQGFPPYKSQDGTSLAAAHVAGLAALIRSLKPSLVPAEILSILRYSSDDVNASIYPGRDDFLGYGRINMEKALVPIKVVK